jgi:hypothetical protein
MGRRDVLLKYARGTERPKTAQFVTPAAMESAVKDLRRTLERFEEGYSGWAVDGFTGTKPGAVNLRQALASAERIIDAFDPEALPIRGAPEETDWRQYVERLREPSGHE